jgi:hypothetical protein
MYFLSVREEHVLITYHHSLSAREEHMLITYHHPAGFLCHTSSGSIYFISVMFHLLCINVLPSSKSRMIALFRAPRSAGAHYMYRERAGQPASFRLRACSLPWDLIRPE